VFHVFSSFHFCVFSTYPDWRYSAVRRRTSQKILFVPWNPAEFSCGGFIWILDAAFKPYNEGTHLIGYRMTAASWLFSMANSGLWMRPSLLSRKRGRKGNYYYTKKNLMQREAVRHSAPR